MAAMYGDDHPYGRKTKGTVEIVDSLTRDRLLALHAARFAPSETTLVIVGQINGSAAFAAARRVFGGWQAPRPASIALPAVGRPASRQRRVLEMMNKAQADIAYGFIAVTRSDPAYYAYWVMNVALGQYALGGRLGDSIRERQGMAYYVASMLDANVLEGPLLIRAGVSPANVDRAIASIDEELLKLRRDGLTEKELNETRRYLIGSMPRALETNSGIASFLQSSEYFGLGLDFDRRLADLVGAVTLEAVHDAARSVLNPEQATIIVAGPYEGSCR
jgi:zinc protease